MKYDEQFKMPNVSRNGTVNGSFLSLDGMGYRDSFDLSPEQQMVFYFENHCITEDPSPEMLFHLKGAEYFSSDIIVSLIENDEILSDFVKACLLNLPSEYYNKKNSYQLDCSIEFLNKYVEHPDYKKNCIAIAINHMKQIKVFENKLELIVKTMFDCPEKLKEIKRNDSECYPELACDYEDGECQARLFFGRASEIRVISKVDKDYNVTFVPCARVLDCDIPEEGDLEKIAKFKKTAKEKYNVSFDEIDFIKGLDVAKSIAKYMVKKGVTKYYDIDRAHVDNYDGTTKGFQVECLRNIPYFLKLLQKEIDFLVKKDEKMKPAEEEKSINVESRIKPRKEKRWLALMTDKRLCSNRLFKSLNEAQCIAPGAKSYKEIEVDV